MMDRMMGREKIGKVKEDTKWKELDIEERNKQWKGRKIRMDESEKENNK